MRVISARKESAAAAVATIVKGADRLSVPACSKEPSATGFGKLSPDTSAQSNSDRPAATRASTGTRSPAASRMVMPGRISSTGR